jgi:hypothetical protein
MQFQAIGPEKGAEESMRRQTKSPLIESRTHHDEPSAKARDLGLVGTRQVANSTAVILPIVMRFCRCSRVTSNASQLDPAIRHKRKEERLPVRSTTSFFCLSKNYISIFSLFSHREGG